jgi:DNA mismatch endonuclease (patch repair protein)
VAISGTATPGNSGFQNPTAEYWEAKIAGNRKRDREVTKQLKRLGWRVLRVWESSLRDEEAVVTKLKLLL